MQPQRETVVYKASAFKGLASRQYEKDLKHRQKQGWLLVSCTESGRDWAGRTVLTAIYEKPGMSPISMPQPGPAMNVQNLQLLLSMLTPEERAGFESEVQAVVNRWLARKATGQL
jgi:hypothetical protein